MNKKGQGALEYLLLIGGAVLVAAIVIALLTGVPSGLPDPQKAAVCATRVNCAACVADTTNSCTAVGVDAIEYSDCAVLEAATTYKYCTTTATTA